VLPAEDRDRPSPPQLVKKVRLRDGRVCSNPFCRRRTGLHAHHIEFRSHGGRTTWLNCVLACVECNKRKANRSLINTGMSLRRPPNVPRWSWDVEIAVGRRRASWGHFLSDRYWNVELTD